MLYVTVSIPEAELRFLRSDGEMMASYRISVFWKNLSSGLSGERIRDRRFERSPDSGWSSRFHAFQTQLSLEPGRYRVSVEFEDRNGRKYGNASREVEVPELSGARPALSSLFLLPSVSAARAPECAGDAPTDTPLNTICAYPYAVGAIPYRVRAVGVSGVGLELRVAVIDSADNTFREERLPLSGGAGDRVCTGAVEGSGLQIGRYRLRAELIGPGGRVLEIRERPFFIASSERWLVDHYDEVVDYLESIAGGKELAEMRAAPAEQRMRLWRGFWLRRDPLPATPANESLEDFFDRLRYANREFSTHIERWWKTDRGRVFLTLGPPDERLLRERRSAFGSWEIWIYDRSHGFRTTLYFEDRGFTGDYRLVNPGAFVRARSTPR